MRDGMDPFYVSMERRGVTAGYDNPLKKHGEVTSIVSYIVSFFSVIYYWMLHNINNSNQIQSIYVYILHINTLYRCFNLTQ
jgi:hypothetical protein